MTTRKVNAYPESTCWNLEFFFDHAKYEYMLARKVNAYPESTCWGLEFFF